jgi:hypothetical protein
MSESDLELLRRYEPVVHYTNGELFFPMAVDDYLVGCEMWAVDLAGRRSLLAPAGTLTIDNLGTWRPATPARGFYLRFVQQPLGTVALTSWRNRPGRPRFSAPSRLARVGIVARMIDAGFDLSLLVRGTVPGGTVAAAQIKYDAIRQRDPRFCYHARVVRQAGWTICHYLFFYAINDWRSSFEGANDHEADWEQCFVFVEENDDGSTTPVWFARAAHDEVGADLRRRWDDPLLRREGDHPIIFAGAGSHAAYIEPGEYLQVVPLSLPPRVRSITNTLQAWWSSAVERSGSGSGSGESVPIAAVPFVDYARGDGVVVGPGQPNTWTPILIDDSTPWVNDYDGLFGLDTEDRFAGERAPAGPKWTREARPRQSWLDPVAFAGLDATPTPGRAVSTLTAEIDDLRAEVDANEAKILELEGEAQRLGVRVSTVQHAGRSRPFVETLTAERDGIVATMRGLRVQNASFLSVIGDSQAELARLRAGDRGDARAHLRHVVHPQDPSEIRLSRLLDVWSAVGVSLAILVLAVLLFAAPQYLWVGLLLVIGVSIMIEALVRRRFLRLLLDVTIILAVIGAVILLASNLVLFIALALLTIGFLILRDNLRELRRA